jgi:HEAT repeat protein
MAHTKEELIRLINLDEPDYPAIVANLTRDDVPLLNELVGDTNVAIATKAISCLGIMNDEKGLEGLEKAARSENPILRVTAAHSLRNMSSRPAAQKLVSQLLDDPDIGVKKFALKTVSASNIKSLKEKVSEVYSRETNEHLKTLSRQVMEKL